MTAGPGHDLLTAAPPDRAPSEMSRIADTVRGSWALVEPHTEELTRFFYGLLFQNMPSARELFPIDMSTQRSRLFRALVHVVQVVDRPDELDPFLAQLGRDHRKFAVTDDHYAALGVALVGAVQEFSGRVWTEDVRAAWTRAYAVIADRMLSAAAGARGPAGYSAEVVEHRRIGWDLAIVSVRPDVPVPFRAGQYLSVETPQRPRLWRYLSPAAPPRADGVIEFHVRAVDGGWVSRAIVAHTALGDLWRIGPPMGRLAIDESSEDSLLMVAGGTGIAPLRALLIDLAAKGVERPTTLFTGGRTPDELYATPFLRAFAADHYWLDLVTVVERPDDGPQDPDAPSPITGTLPAVVSSFGAWNAHDVLVCGSPEMTRATVTQLMVGGTPLERIRYDPFTLD